MTFAWSKPGVRIWPRSARSCGRRSPVNGVIEQPSDVLLDGSSVIRVKARD